MCTGHCHQHPIGYKLTLPMGAEVSALKKLPTILRHLQAYNYEKNNTYYPIIWSKPSAKSTRKKLRNNLHDCEKALSACLSAQNITSDTIFIYTAKEAVKVAKQVEKTKRKVKVQETKQNKNNNKTDVKTDWFLKLDARTNKNDCYFNCWWICGWWCS
jgi:hypothetical protein